MLGVGGFADFELAPESNVHPVPTGVGLDVAALTDVYACAVHAVRLARRTTGGPAAVVGTGGVAMALGQVARASGFSPVTMIGSRSHALSRALEAGAADHVLSSADGHRPPGAEAPREPPCVVFECAGGNGSSMQTALSLIAPGGMICVIGAFWDDVPIGYDIANSKEVSVKFSNAYSQTGTDPEFPAALRLMRDRKVDPRPLITHRFSLDRINEAFAAAADKASSEAIRILIQP
jgi:threonine dehydrogenase-like Zn-dependent dehydrogenase